MPSLEGVEIFAAGTHNGDTYTEQDLDDIIAAYNELDYTPPVKSGHHKDVPGMPALGWVKNLRRVGQKLVADFVDVPEKVYEAIKERRYNTVSSEIYFNLQRAGRVFRRALKAVAILGADIPAVAGLKPLHEVVFDANIEYRSYEFGWEPQGIGEPETEGDMSDERIKELEAQVKTLSEKTASYEAEVKTYKERAAEAEQRLAAIEAERAAERINARIEQCKIPALRDSLRVFAELGYGVTRTYSVGDKSLTPDEALDKLISDINAMSKSVFGETSRSATVSYTDIGAEVDRLTKKYMNETGEKSYSVAMRQVLEANPGLKAEYAKAE